MLKPTLIYGTAWKKELTSQMLATAWQAGFRAFDTACQPKHYREDLVGQALAAIMAQGVQRAAFYLQTKYTSPNGQDTASIPYDARLPIAKQVAASFKASQMNLFTQYIDGLILHSPFAQFEQTLEAWRAMELIHQQGLVGRLGISNCYDSAEFKRLYQQAQVKPTIVQNRFYSKTLYDKELRAFCLDQQISYQSFWTLTANPHLLEHGVLVFLSRRLRKSPAQILFRYLQLRGVTPLTGTTDIEHMREDLEVTSIELSAEDLASIDRLLV